MEETLLQDEVLEIVDSETDDDEPTDDEPTDDQLENRYHNVITSCCEYLSRKVSADNSIRMLLFADDHRLNPMVDYCAQYIGEHVAEVLSSDEFLEVSVRRLKQLLQLLGSRAIAMEDVRNGVLLWAEYEPDQRYRYLDDVWR